MFGVIGKAGAGHQVEVFEGGVEAFAEAVVQFAERGVGVDDGVVRGELGHWCEALGRAVLCHK